MSRRGLELLLFSASPTQLQFFLWAFICTLSFDVVPLGSSSLKPNFSIQIVKPVHPFIII